MPPGSGADTTTMRKVIEYFRSIGRKGGSRSSEAKREAARRNILLRRTWGINEQEWRQAIEAALADLTDRES